MIVCSAKSDLTQEAVLARLLAIELLPVGERLARKTANPYVLVRPLWCRLWNRAHYIPNPSFGIDNVISFYRPLRIARERAKKMGLWRATAAQQLSMLIRDDRALKEAAKTGIALVEENARLRAALEEALSSVRVCSGSCRGAEDRIRAIAEGRTK